MMNQADWVPRFRRLVSLSSVFVLILLLLTLAGCITEDDLSLEQRAFLLDSQLLCPICDGQTVDQSQAQIAVDIRTTVRQKLEEGLTNQEIRDFFVSRYGTGILAAPEASGFGLLAWIVPAIIAVIGLFILGYVIRDLRLKRKVVPVEGLEEPARATDNSLEQVERELGNFVRRSAEKEDK